MKVLSFSVVLVLAAASLPLASAAPPADSARATRPVAQGRPGPLVQLSGRVLVERPWYRPKHLVLQTAGGLGMVAAGAGYEHWKDRLETDILIGYVPKTYAPAALTLASLKLLYSPFRLAVGQKWQVLPLTVGAYFSYTHGTINDELKGQYSSDYYWFSTDTRYGPLLGSRLTYLAPAVKATGQPRRISAFYELGSNDLYILSYTTNTKGLGLHQILTLALGVKADF